jgi:hypothetical protein
MTCYAAIPLISANLSSLPMWTISRQAGRLDYRLGMAEVERTDVIGARQLFAAVDVNRPDCSYE